jgi:hypothetical protein
MRMIEGKMMLSYRDYIIILFYTFLHFIAMTDLISPRFVRLHKLSIAISLFLFFMFLVHFTKPAFIYNDKGGFRPFGLGYRNFTVFPIWIVSIVLAILSYFLVIWFIGF